MIINALVAVGAELLDAAVAAGTHSLVLASRMHEQQQHELWRFASKTHRQYSKYLFHLWLFGNTANNYWVCFLGIPHMICDYIVFMKFVCSRIYFRNTANHSWICVLGIPRIIWDFVIFRKYCKLLWDLWVVVYEIIHLYKYTYLPSGHIFSTSSCRPGVMTRRCQPGVTSWR